MSKNQIKQLSFEISRILSDQHGLIVKYINEIPVELHGNYVVRDSNGAVQGDFDILVKIPSKYPFEFPMLYVTTPKYEWIDDRHTSENGFCCVEITHKILLLRRRGIRLIEFFKNYVHKFFCWQILYDELGAAALKQWDHGKSGVRTFYQELLNTTDASIIRKILEAFVFNRMPDKKDKCICGSGKAFKKCHSSILFDLQSLSIKVIAEDVKIFII